VRVSHNKDITLLKETARILRREYKSLLEEFDTELWAILRTEENRIFAIKDWEIYRRATEISNEIPTSRNRKKARKDDLPVLVL
jgi:hypothetical protein